MRLDWYDIHAPDSRPIRINFNRKKIGRVLRPVLCIGRVLRQSERAAALQAVSDGAYTLFKEDRWQRQLADSVDDFCDGLAFGARSWPCFCFIGSNSSNLAALFGFSAESAKASDHILQQN